MRKLATIENVMGIKEIPEADKVVIAKIRGWNCVVSKEEFKEGDKCIYFEIDSLIPKGDPRFDFLEKFCYHPSTNSFRIRTIKLRGVYSQGLAIPISKFPEFSNMGVGTDVSEELKVIKYEAPISINISGCPGGEVPGYIISTGIERIQNVEDYLTTYKDKNILITEKLNGTSNTYYVFGGEFFAASSGFYYRDIEENKDKARFLCAKKYDVKDKLISMKRNIAIQGELIGDRIQKNNYKYKLNDIDFFVFRIYDIEKGDFFHYQEAIRFCKNMGLKFVPILGERKMFESIEEAIEYSNFTSKLADTKAEGIVCDILDTKYNKMQFKVINPEFLIRNKE